MTQPVQPATPPAVPPTPVPAPPTPAPVPQVPTPPTQPTPVPVLPLDPNAPSGPGITFPAATAWRDMTGEQQVAYWQHQAKKHEARAAQVGDYEQLKADQQRYQELLTQTQTEQEKAVAAARREGEQTATGRANEALVEAYFRAASAARQVSDDDVTELLDQVDRRKFIAANGQVDTTRIYGLVNKLAPQPVAAPVQPVAPVAPQAVPQPQWPGTPAWQPPQPPAGWQVPQPPAAVTAPPAMPDMGQGQFTQAPPSGLEAGRAAARAKFGTKSPA